MPSMSQVVAPTVAAPARRCLRQLAQVACERVERSGLRVFGQHGVELLGDRVDGLVPGDALELARAALARAPHGVHDARDFQPASAGCGMERRHALAYPAAPACRPAPRARACRRAPCRADGSATCSSACTPRARPSRRRLPEPRRPALRARRCPRAFRNPAARTRRLSRRRPDERATGQLAVAHEVSVCMRQHAYRSPSSPPPPRLLRWLQRIP